jgi:hypothetical protein
MIIRQSTARTILVGPVLDSTGAAKTDEVVGNIKVTKNGTVGAADGSATLDHDHAGKYRLALTENDCDTVGVLEISLNSGTNDMPVKSCNVIETAIWDALFDDGATGLLPANVTQIGGDTQSATDLKDFADAGYDPTTNKVNAELDSSVTAQLDDIESDTTAALSSLSSITSAISAIAAIFTGMTSLPNWLRRAWRKDAGTAGMSTAQTEINTGGTATFAGTTDSQEAIKDALGSSGGGPAYSAAVVAARLPVGSAAGWPQEILCGAAYLTELGTHIPLYVKDVDENILAAMGDKTFADGDFKAILRLSPLTDANKLLAQPTATIEVDSDDTPGVVFNDDTSGEEYFELQIPKAKTALGEIRTRYLCQVILRWGDGSEYEWIVNLGESKFIRGVSAAA